VQQSSLETRTFTNVRRPRRRAVLGALLVALAASSPAAAQPAAKAKPPGAAPAPGAQAGLSDARKLGDAFAAIAERVSPSVVQIDVVADVEGESPMRWAREDGVARGMGSGVVFSSDGAILTNNHVIENARSINVRLYDGRLLPARLVGRDPATDLAVLRVEAKDLPAAKFADSGTAKVGEWVLAIGSPFGLGYTVTTGVLSAKGRGGLGVNAVEDYLQTDASINPGNSGGPLVDLDGEVLGINTMTASRGQGIGLAVPARMAARVADQILKKGRVERAWIGVGIQDLTPQIGAEIPGAPREGAIVNSVAPNSPASKGNLEPGDVVLALAGKPVRDAQEVIREVFLHDVGDVLALEVLRHGQRYQTKVVLEARSEPPPPALPIELSAAPQPGLGLTLRDVPDPRPRAPGEKAKPLAQVTHVAPGSAADRAGLRPGDLVLEVDGARDPASADVQAQAKDGHVLLRLMRRGASFYAAVR
jgi:S1-C subfamily serine protease